MHIFSHQYSFAFGFLNFNASKNFSPATVDIGLGWILEAKTWEFEDWAKNKEIVYIQFFSFDIGLRNEWQKKAP